jgi:undecaprenyl-diphosphatase
MGVLGGLISRNSGAIAFVRNLLLAFFPAVILGLLFSKTIDALLEDSRVVAWALIVGGIAILIVERFAKTRETGGVSNLSIPQSVKIGLAQCVAMIPGVSRSGATILGGMAFGVDRKTAAEFSFFLAVPTLAGATALQLFKARHDITADSLGLIGIGATISFVVALIVVKGFMAIDTRNSFAPFAWYRIAAGVAALIWLGV